MPRLLPLSLLRSPTWTRLDANYYFDRIGCSDNTAHLCFHVQICRELNALIVSKDSEMDDLKNQVIRDTILIEFTVDCFFISGHLVELSTLCLHCHIFHLYLHLSKHILTGTFKNGPGQGKNQGTFGDV